MFKEMSDKNKQE
jgi:serine/threonine-protein phosphatase PP1 catalytic subunit